MSETLIIQTKSLQSYFYESLSEVNKSTLCPLPEATIHYSSNVLDRFSTSDNYFVQGNGRTREKVLGMELLKAKNESRHRQRKIYRDIGDTALFICGYFFKSMDSKLMDISYYKKIGKTAYSHLNHFESDYFGEPEFYNKLVTCFDTLTKIISKVALSDQSDPYEHIIFNKVTKGEEVSEDDLLVNNIILPDSDQAS